MQNMDDSFLKEMQTMNNELVASIQNERVKESDK